MALDCWTVHLCAGRKFGRIGSTVMKELHATARVSTAASVEETLALLRGVEGYPRWYPEGVRSVEVLEDGGAPPAMVRATLHLGHGPLVRDFRMRMTVSQPDPASIRLARVPHDPSDHERFVVTWRVASRGARTEIELVLDADLSVPRMLPVGGVAEVLARGFVDAAARALG
jgi:Polyketide cyclase / dehydrase and lipid transport